MQHVRRVLVIRWEIKILRSLCKRVNELKVARLSNEFQWPMKQVKEDRVTHEISHRFVLYTTRHTPRCPWSHHFGLVCFIQIPNDILWMTKHPKVIPTSVGELMEI